MRVVIEQFSMAAKGLDGTCKVSEAPWLHSKQELES